MKLYSHGIKVSLVQPTHRQHDKAEECILGLAADIDAVLEAQIDFAVGFTDAEFGSLRDKSEIALEAPAEVHQCRTGGQSITQRVKGWHLNELRHDQAEVGVVGRVHAGAIESGYRSRRQTSHRVVG